MLSAVVDLIGGTKAPTQESGREEANNLTAILFHIAAARQSISAGAFSRVLLELDQSWLDFFLEALMSFVRAALIAISRRRLFTEKSIGELAASGVLLRRLPRLAD
jgi:hypothetical protein